MPSGAWSGGKSDRAPAGPPLNDRNRVPARAGGFSDGGPPKRTWSKVARRVGGIHLFSFPWPGPGNSEALGDSEGWFTVEGHEEAGALHGASETALLTTFPWPRPGDSEA